MLTKKNCTSEDMANPYSSALSKEQGKYVIREIHEGICCYHSRSRTMATRILRVGHFWPTMEVDCNDFVKK